MIKAEIDAINRQRLDDWRKRLTSEHATPLILLGVGHDHLNGQWCICTLEEEGGLSDREIVAALRGVADMLERNQVERRL